MKYPRMVIAGILILLPLLSLRGAPPTGAEEAIFSVRYYNYEATYLIYFKRDNIFIPLLAFINDFKIFNEFDAESLVLKGYISNPKNAYKVNLKRFEGEFLGKSYYYPSESYFFDGAELYCNLDFLKSSLGIQSKPDKDFLTITITSPIELPILKFRGKRRSANALSYNEEDRSFPNYGSRSWRALDGGALDWSLNSSHVSGYTSFGASAAIGVSALGGDLVVRDYLSRLPNEDRVRNATSWTWRYFISDNGWLSQISLGEVFPMGRSFAEIRTNRIVGAQLTNETYKMPLFFRNKLIEGNAQAGWVVELYKNSQLYDQALTDANGKFSFNAPVTYGYNDYELKYYGEKGEYINKEFVYEVPAELLRKGEVKYTAAFGNDLLYEDRVAEGKLSIGVTNWLTNTTYFLKSFDKDSAINPILAKPDIINILSLTPLPGVFARLAYNHEKFVSAYLKTNLSKNLFIEARHTANDKTYKIGGQYWSELKVTLPSVMDQPLSLFLAANRYSYGNNANSTFSLSANSFLNPFFLAVNYFIIGNERNKDFKIGSHNALADFSYFNYGRSDFLFGVLKDTRIGVRGSWTSANPKEPIWGAYVNKQLSPEINFGFSASSVGALKDVNIFAQLSMRLSYFNTMTSSNVNGGKYSLTQQVAGSLGVDTEDFRLDAASSRGGGYVGRGIAKVRFFMDANDNGAFDKGEKALSDYNVNLVNSTAFADKKGDYIILSNLNPYERINVQADETYAVNPLILPQKREFSFLSDPNVYQEINIPCVMGGVIEGAVLFELGPDSVAGQRGVRLLLKNLETGETETLNVFSDGSFYKIGVAPGEYTLSVDEKQINILKAWSEPLKIKINNSIDGDYVSGLIIKLYPAEKNAPKTPRNK